MKWWEIIGDRYLPRESGRDEYARVVQAQPQGTVGHSIFRVLNTINYYNWPRVLRNVGSRGLGEFARNEPLLRAEATQENIDAFSHRETEHFARSDQFSQRIIGRTFTARDRSDLILIGRHGRPDQIVDALYKKFVDYVRERTPDRRLDPW